MRTQSSFFLQLFGNGFQGSRALLNRRVLGIPRRDAEQVLEELRFPRRRGAVECLMTGSGWRFRGLAQPRLPIACRFVC